ncbi:MAG: helix-turn-helix domain-containing protein [Flavobacteriales bacterium]
MPNRRIGEKIRKVRDLRGYSQEYMAEQLGVSQKQYGRYETGDTDPGVERLESIAKLLGLSLVDLLSFDEKIFFNQCTQPNVYGANNTYHEASEREREQLLERIKHLEEEVAFLREEMRKR